MSKRATRALRGGMCVCCGGAIEIVITGGWWGRRDRSRSRTASTQFPPASEVPILTGRARGAGELVVAQDALCIKQIDAMCLHVFGIPLRLRCQTWSSRNAHRCASQGSQHRRSSAIFQAHAAVPKFPGPSVARLRRLFELIGECV
jgi:hypothetical protein